MPAPPSPQLIPSPTFAAFPLPASRPRLYQPSSASTGSQNGTEQLHSMGTRNTSIDSVGSLGSSASYQQAGRPSVASSQRQLSDAWSTAGALPDIAGLITSAGTAEAVIMALWRDKQSDSTRNSQLWRLVEKQRAMILGLNKDLERALKDKDRYRKKLKDQLAQSSKQAMLPSLDFSSINGRDTSQSPALSDPLEDTSLGGGSKSDPFGTNPGLQYSSLSAAERDLELSARPKSPVSPASSAGRLIGGSQEQLSSLINQPSGIAGMTDHASLGPKSSRPFNEISGKGHGLAQKQTDQSQTERRKGPPKPLDLKKGHVSDHLKPYGAPDGSESEYEDLLEIHEIPAHDRGRRKTREEDDRLREVALLQEVHERSRSKKSSTPKGKSASKRPLSDGEVIPATPGILTSNDLAHRPSSDGVTYHVVPASPVGSSDSNSIAAVLNAAVAPDADRNKSAALDRNALNLSLVDQPSRPISPGLPISPRPGIGFAMSALQPRSPRAGLNSPTFNGGNPVLMPRPPKQPIPQPPTSPTGMPRPEHLVRAESYYRHPQQQEHEQQQQQQDRLHRSIEASLHQRQPSSHSGHGHNLLQVPSADSGLVLDSGSANDGEQVYRGFVSDQYPNFLLSPDVLPLIELKISSSRLLPSRNSFIVSDTPINEDPVFTLAICSRSDGKQLWRLEKTISALINLDRMFRQLCTFQGKLPDKSLFNGHAPAKVDARREALSSYFEVLLDTPMEEKAALVVCDFFSNDVIGALAESPKSSIADKSGSSQQAGQRGKMHKEGYLTKKGKNFGGWKAKFFVLDGAELRYYEGQGGPHLGTVKLNNAQIGKQSQQNSNVSDESPSRSGDDPDGQYRHAFLVLEPKRKDSKSLVRHALCAESDDERDAWVEALLRGVEYHEVDTAPGVEGATAGAAVTAGDAMTDKMSSAAMAPKKLVRRSRRPDSPGIGESDELRATSYDEMTAAEAPRFEGPNNANTREESYSLVPPVQRSISGPTNGAPIQNAQSWGNKPVAPTPPAKERKRNIFGFRGKSSPETTTIGSGAHATSHQHHLQHQLQQHHSSERTPQLRPVFGLQLADAVVVAPPVGVETGLPAVVYRCLEYLQTRDAASEEGIFRLSGSNIVIKALRDRFNNEGDVNLVDGQYYDVHAVASLLKLYLRELPAPILTRELHLDFLKVLDVSEKSKKVEAFNLLVHRLPQENFDLLSAMSEFLMDIINNSDVNKMTVRNVGIVFAPTLNIPAPLISIFLTEFEKIFNESPGQRGTGIREVVIDGPTTTDSIRSPRKQMFTDLPTPAHNQTFFQQQQHHHQQQQQQRLNRPPSMYSTDPAAYHGSYLYQQPQSSHMPLQMTGLSSSVADETGLMPLQPSYETPVFNPPDRRQRYSSLTNGGSSAYADPGAPATHRNTTLAPSAAFANLNNTLAVVTAASSTTQSTGASYTPPVPPPSSSSSSTHGGGGGGGGGSVTANGGPLGIGPMGQGHDSGSRGAPKNRTARSSPSPGRAGLDAGSVPMSHAAKARRRESGMLLLGAGGAQAASAAVAGQGMSMPVHMQMEMPMQMVNPMHLPPSHSTPGLSPAQRYHQQRKTSSPRRMQEAI